MIVPPALPDSNIPWKEAHHPDTKLFGFFFGSSVCSLLRHLGVLACLLISGSYIGKRLRGVHEHIWARFFAWRNDRNQGREARVVGLAELARDKGGTVRI